MFRGLSLLMLFTCPLLSYAVEDCSMSLENAGVRGTAAPRYAARRQKKILIVGRSGQIELGCMVDAVFDSAGYAVTFVFGKSNITSVQGPFDLALVAAPEVEGALPVLDSMNPQPKVIGYAGNQVEFQLLRDANIEHQIQEPEFHRARIAGVTAVDRVLGIK